MRKALILTLTICLIFPLCGCSAKRAVSNDGQEYIVSALGFDGDGDKLKITLEALVVNSDDLEADKKTRLIFGVGENSASAFSEIIAQATQPLALGHNGAVIIGSKISPNQLDDILNFIGENEEINVASMLIFSDSAEKLLSKETVSSAAVGYDIVSMIEVSKIINGMEFKNRFFEVQSELRKPLRTFSLPCFYIVEDGFLLGGTAFFKENRQSVILNLENSRISGFITDTLHRGDYLINGVNIKTEYSKTTYDFEFKDRLYLTVNVRFKADKNFDFNIINVFFQQIKADYGDIWGIGNIIYQKKPKIWNKIKDDYESYFKNSVLRVKVYE